MPWRIPVPQLHEPFLISDVYASDIARADILNQNVRLIFFAEEYRDAGSAPANRIACKIVMPREAVAPAFSRILFSLGHDTSRQTIVVNGIRRLM